MRIVPRVVLVAVCSPRRLLGTWLLPARLLPNVWVGLTEEALKAAGVIVFARGLRVVRVARASDLGPSSACTSRSPL